MSLASKGEPLPPSERPGSFRSDFCVSLLGITGVRIWLGCIPYAQMVLGDGSLDLVLSNFFRGLFPVLVALALFRKKTPRKILGLLNATCTVVLVVLGEFLWFSEKASSSLVLLAIASMAAGWLYVQWGEVYARLSLPQAMAHACLSLALAGCAVIALSFCPDVVTGAALAGFPLVGCFLYASSLDRHCASEADGSIRPLPKRQPALSLGNDGKWALSLAVYAILWGIMQALPFGFMAERTSLYHIVYRLGGAALVLVPVAWIYLLKRNFNLLYVWYLITGAAVASFLMILIDGSSLSGTALTLFAVGNYSVLAYWWVRCVDFSQRSSRPASAVFAVGWCVLLTGISFGEVIAKWVYLQDNAQVLLVSLGIFLIVSYLTVLLHPDKASQKIAGSPRVIVETSEAPDARDSIEARIDRASETYRFTPREKEVMALLCHGHTLQYASDQLGISLNTTRGHIKRIYAKLDVHSKEEMLIALQATAEDQRQ